MGGELSYARKLSMPEGREGVRAWRRKGVRENEGIVRSCGRL